jgi:hypothetical protein
MQSNLDNLVIIGWFELWIIYIILSILLPLVFFSQWYHSKNITKWVTMFFFAGVEIFPINLCFMLKWIRLNIYWWSLTVLYSLTFCWLYHIIMWFAMFVFVRAYTALGFSQNNNIKLRYNRSLKSFSRTVWHKWNSFHEKTQPI